ncbi:hypothetical protein CTAYLR_000358 [Chrysophaeum taylorii]|uniref:NadR/Ttd14 AAA domain-containing protein n=1 Tax=Chrysophaeum taylorii TaxID=2483200 RepID=A0AAD7UFZ9_9STRA|nr:hypothetical protein CTAYLR_000358 [Chrysophaeum taylorii]
MWRVASSMSAVAVAIGWYWFVRKEKDEEEEEPGAHVYRIVLTGGPCAGKTTALARLSGFLQERGFRVYTVPEVATMLFVNGAAFADLARGDESVLAFQTAVLDGQMALENGFARVAGATKSPAVLLCDRGALDGAAYMSRDLWTQLLRGRRRRREKRSVGAVERALCERYDAVFHLVTAAQGAERFYSLENNAARTEPVEKAREQDMLTQKAWKPHPRQLVFDNSAGELGFEGKLQRVVEATAKLVGLPVLPKSTRKFKLVQQPDEAVFRKYGVDVTAFFVTKTFLKKVSGAADGYSYVRLRYQSDGSTSYGHATVHVDTTGEKIERKRRCSPREYAAHLANADPDRAPVQQRRLHFLWQNQSFVIHKYADRDLAILHIQAARADGSIDFPPFLDVGPEISEQATYSSYHIARVDSASSLSDSSAMSTVFRRHRRPQPAKLDDPLTAEFVLSRPKDPAAAAAAAEGSPSPTTDNSPASAPTPR